MSKHLSQKEKRELYGPDWIKLRAKRNILILIINLMYSASIAILNLSWPLIFLGLAIALALDAAMVLIYRPKLKKIENYVNNFWKDFEASKK